MLKIFTLCSCIFVFVFAVGLLIAAWPMLPIMAVISLVLLALFAVAAGVIALYYFLGKAKIHHATAYSIMLEAGKVAATNSVLVLDRQIIQLPNFTTVSGAAPAPALVEASDPIQAVVVGLPEAPALAELFEQGFRPTQKRMLLGYSLAGPLYGTITDLLSVAVAGRPGQGKSSLLRFIYAQVILAGGKVFMLDPHGSIIEDVQGAPCLWMASTAQELDQAAALMVAELDRRLDMYRSGSRDFQPIMGLVDEFPIISLSSKKAVAATGRIVLEGRKVNMFSLISGQGLPASQFGGSLVRDALSSRYVFKTTTRQGQLAGLDKEAWSLLESLDTGRAVFDGPVKPTILAIPWTAGSDLLRLNPDLADSSPGAGPVDPAASAAPAAGRGPVDPAAPAPSPVVGAAGRGSYYETITTEYNVLPAFPDELEKAYRAWLAGNNSVRKLATALNVSKYQADLLVNDLRARGLI